MRYKNHAQKNARLYIFADTQRQYTNKTVKVHKKSQKQYTDHTVTVHRQNSNNTQTIQYQYIDHTETIHRLYSGGIVTGLISPATLSLAERT